MADVTLRAETELAAAKAELESLKQALADVGEETEQEQQKNEGLNVGLANLMMGMSVAKMSVDMLGQAYNATLGVYMDYAKQVRDITAATGLQTEEVSRMIEVADDAGVEIGTLKAALREMGKDGVAPTVDELANLADKFKLIQDPALRTQFLMESFGRAGLEMGKLMEQSGDSIRSASAVMDQEMAVKARALEVALDGVSDALRNELIKAVDVLIPTLTEAANTMELLVTWNSRLKAATEDHEAAVVKSADSWAAYVTEMRRASLAAQGLTEDQIKERQGLDQLYGSIEETARALKLKNQAEFDAARGVKDYAARLAEATVAQKEQAKSEVDLAYDVQQGNNALADRYQAMGAQYQQTGPLTDAQERLTNSLIAQRYAGYAAADATRDQAAAASEAKNMMTVLNEAIAGPIRQENERYAESVATDQEKLAALNEELKKYTVVAGATYTTTLDKKWATYDLTDATLKLQTAQANLNALEADASKGGTAEQRAAKLATLRDTISDLTGKMSDYNAAVSQSGQTYAANATSEDAYVGKGKEIKAQIDELTGAINKEAADHETATKKILFNIVAQQIAQANLGTEGATFLTDLASKWGLVDEKTATATKNIISAVGQAATDKNFDALSTRLGLVLDTTTTDKAKSTEASIKALPEAIRQAHQDNAWTGLHTKYTETQTDSDNLKTAVQQQTEASGKHLATQATDPNWEALRGQISATEKAYNDVAYSIRMIPDKKTITITTRYVTEGIPTAVAASAGP